MSEASLQFFPFLLVFVVFWFLIIAPQRKEQQEREKLRKSIAKGDEVVTTSGMHGEITKVDGELVTLKIAEKTHVVFEKNAIRERLGAPAAERSATAS